MEPLTLTITFDGNLGTEALRTVLTVKTSALEQRGMLPANPTLHQCLKQWQETYRSIPVTARIKPKEILYQGKTKISSTCKQAAERLKSEFLQWLNHPDFLPIDRQIRELLHPNQPVKIRIRASDWQVHRLPWHHWDLIDRHPQTSLAFSHLECQVLDRPASPPQPKIQILAVFGDSAGLDLSIDQHILDALPNAQVSILTEPTRAALTDTLWNTPWDILCFSGHSKTEDGKGLFSLNGEVQLSLEELRYAMRKAIANGLKLAIFNSCDGLGLAKSLLDLNLPYFVVMREPLPDAIAHHFLSSFLQHYSQGDTLSQSLRQAQERLQGQEEDYPCASWLPIFYENTLDSEPSWQSFLPATSSPTPQPKIPTPLSWPTKSLAGVLVSLAILGIRFFGGFEGWELKAYSLFIQWHPVELADDRLLLVTIDDEDIRYQEQQGMSLQSSLAPEALQILVAELQSFKPTSIGLDIYRSQPINVEPSAPLFPICKVPAPEGGDAYGVDPPPDIEQGFVGFSDFVVDQEDQLRRQLLAIKNTAPNSNCAAHNSLNLLLATHYLQSQGYQYELNGNKEFIWGETRWPRLSSSSGGYHGLDASGYQLLLRYRQSKTLEAIAPSISLRDFLQQKIPDSIRKKFQNRIVLIGSISASSSDRWQTPLTTTPLDKSTGLHLQAQMVSQLISSVVDQRSLMYWWSDWQESLWIIISITGMSILIYQPNRWQVQGLIMILTGGSIGGVAYVCFIKGLWIPLVPIWVGLLLLPVMPPVMKRVKSHWLK